VNAGVCVVIEEGAASLLYAICMIGRWHLDQIMWVFHLKTKEIHQIAVGVT